MPHRRRQLADVRLLFEHPRAAAVAARAEGASAGGSRSSRLGTGVLATLLGDRSGRVFGGFAAERRDPRAGRFHSVFHAESTEGGHFRVEDVSGRCASRSTSSRYVGAEVLQMLKERKRRTSFGRAATR